MSAPPPIHAPPCWNSVKQPTKQARRWQNGTAKSWNAKPRQNKKSLDLGRVALSSLMLFDGPMPVRPLARYDSFVRIYYELESLPEADVLRLAGDETNRLTRDRVLALTQAVQELASSKY